MKLFLMIILLICFVSFIFYLVSSLILNRQQKKIKELVNSWEEKE